MAMALHIILPPGEVFWKTGQTAITMNVRASEKSGARRSGKPKGTNGQHAGRSTPKGSTLYHLQEPQTQAEYEVVA